MNPDHKRTDASPYPKRTLLGPGPSEMPPRIAAALSRPLIGHLDPVDTDSGLQQRLSNLGYWPTGEDSTAALPYCLRAFQEDHDLEITGEANRPTYDKLKEVHGGI